METLGGVYANGAVTKERKMTPACAAILNAEASMTGNGIDVMMCRNETVDGWRSAV